MGFHRAWSVRRVRRQKSRERNSLTVLIGVSYIFFVLPRFETRRFSLASLFLGRFTRCRRRRHRAPSISRTSRRRETLFAYSREKKVTRAFIVQLHVSLHAFCRLTQKMYSHLADIRPRISRHVETIHPSTRATPADFYVVAKTRCPSAGKREPLPLNSSDVGRCAFSSPFIDI